MMDHIQNQVLEWHRQRGVIRSLTKSFVLRLDGKPVGKLRYDQSSPESALAVANDDSWLFIYTRFIEPRISVWDKNQEFVAGYRSFPSLDGLVEFRQGVNYLWKPIGVMGDEWEFQTSEAETFIRFVRDDANWNIRGRVEACLIAIDHPDFPLLSLLGCYILNHIVVAI
jgi:hypothetical protein